VIIWPSLANNENTLSAPTSYITGFAQWLTLSITQYSSGIATISITSFALISGIYSTLSPTEATPLARGKIPIRGYVPTILVCCCMRVLCVFGVCVCVDVGVSHFLPFDIFFYFSVVCGLSTTKPQFFPFFILTVASGVPREYR
jgi:hypothetical protein